MPNAPVRRESGAGLSYVLAALGILTSLSLGVATLMLGLPPVEPELQGPSVSIEETDPSQGSDTPNDAESPGFDPRQANLVAAEDERLYSTVGQIEPGSSPHDVKVGNQLPSVVLPARPAPYDLNTLTSTGAVVRQSDGSLLLQKGVLVGAGAQLRLTAPNTTLRMSSGPQGFATLIAFKGSMVLEGNDGAPLTISSWDPTKSAPDTEPSDGRSYIRSVGGRMDLRSVNTSDLGFWSGRTGGVAWTGSASESATGSARAVSFVRNHYGVFSDRTKGLLINGAEIKNSAMDGVAVNRDSEATELWRVVSAESARNGIAIAKGAHNISLREVTTTGNARNGIFLDGTPPALGPNAGGGTTAHSAGFVVDGSTVRGNAEHGILVTGANNTQLTRNTVAANRDGIIVRGVTQGVALRENRISSPGGFAVAIRDGAKDALVDKNIISDALTAVQINDAVAKVSGNEIDQMTLHAVSITGNGNGSSVVDNRVAGRGPSSIDLNRIAPGALVDISGNDEANWDVDRDDVQYLANFVRGHPLILLWALILVFPLAGRIYFKHRRDRQAIGQHPYQQVAAVSPTGTPAAALAPMATRAPAQARPKPAGNTARPGQPARPASAGKPMPGQNGTKPDARNASKQAVGKPASPPQRPGPGLPTSPRSASPARQPAKPPQPASRPQPNSRQQPPARQQPGAGPQPSSRQPAPPAAPGKPGEQASPGQGARPSGKSGQGPNKRPPQGGGGTRVTVVSPK